MALAIIFSNINHAQKSTKVYNEKENVVNWPDGFNPKESKFYVYNEIDIEAAPEKVWQLLIEAEKWPSFYEGAKNVKVNNGDGAILTENANFDWETMGFKFNSVIKEFVPNSRLSWQSYKKGIAGYHAWVIVPTENGCKLITAESQNGWITYMEKIFQPNKLFKLHDVWLAEIKNSTEGKTSFTLNIEEREKLVIILTDSYNKFLNEIKYLSTEQLYYKANDNQWSIAECIEHITLAELHFPEIVAEEMQKTAVKNKKTKYSDSEIRTKMTSAKWRAKSPKKFKPSNKFDSVESTIDAFKNQRLQTIEYVKTTSDNLRVHYWWHPLTGSIDLYQTLILMSAHLERHTHQIKKLKIDQIVADSREIIKNRKE